MASGWNRNTEELMDRYRELAILLGIRTGKLQWLGRAERMPKEMNIEEVFKNIPRGKGPWESQETDVGRRHPVGFKLQY
jgi:hypothetical protein